MRGLAKILRAKKIFFLSCAYDVCDENAPGAYEGVGENQARAYIYTYEGVHENTPMRHLTKLTYTHEGTHENERMRGLTKTNKMKNNLRKNLTFMF